MPPDARADWLRLAGADATAEAVPTDTVDELPDPVRRWLRRCVPVGATGSARMTLTMEGDLRIGRWMPFRARQVLVGPLGMVWAARASVGPAWIEGSDRIVDGRGSMSWRLLGLVPVMRASGPDVDRSAAGRLAGELLLNPFNALAPWVRWSAVDDSTVDATVELVGSAHRIRLQYGADGLVESVTFPRWGAPHGGAYAEHTFRVAQSDTVDAGGVTVPGRLVAAWDDDEPFFRARISSARIG